MVFVGDSTAQAFRARKAWCENLPGFRPKGDDKGEACCELHDDKSPSLFVGWAGAEGVYHCLACGQKGTLTEYGILTSKAPFPVPQRSNIGSTAAIRHVYLSPHSEPVLRVNRKTEHGKKTYPQEKWDGRAWRFGGVNPTPLYQADRLAKARVGSTVFLVEGEKCADWLSDRGLLATTAPEGACKFNKVSRDYLDLLTGLGVVILPDNDAAGYQHAIQVGRRLRKDLGLEAKVLILPGLGPKEDVADWLQLPRTKEDFLSLAATAMSFLDFELSEESKNGLGSNERTLDAGEKPAPPGWEPPIPIDVAPTRPPFPLESLPPVLATYTQEVAQSLQVPPDCVAMSGFAVIGTVLQKRVDLDVGKGAVFPLNIWTLGVYPSGGGKSRALTEARFPLDEWEQSLQEKAAQLNESASIDRQDLEHRLNDLLRNKSRSEDDEAELRQLRGRLRDLEDRPIPELYSTDLTMEALEMAMSANDGCHAVLNAEASDFFQIMAGRYAKEGQSSFGHFVSAYSQEDIKTKRALRGNSYIHKPTLTMGLFIQPSVFEKIASNREFVTRGLPARFLFAYPKDMRGSRDVDPPAITRSARDSYNAVVRALTRIEPSRDAKGRLEPYRISLKMEARKAFIEFRQWAEDSMGPGGSFAEVGKEFAARMAEHLAKVTGILHCVLHPEQPWEVCVDRSTVENAAKVVRWSSEHVLTTLGMGTGSERHQRAAYLHGRIADQRKWLEEGCFTVRSLQQLVKRKERYKSGGARALEQDLRFLEELGYLQRCEMPKQGSKSTIFKISPFFLKNGPQGPQQGATLYSKGVSLGDTRCPIVSQMEHNVPDGVSATLPTASYGDPGTAWDTQRPQVKALDHKGLSGYGVIGDQNPVEIPGDIF